MSDSVIVTAKSFPQPETLALVSDVQFREPYSSAAINRKMRGIIGAGIYAGFNPTPGTGLNLLISSGTDGGTCSFNIGAYYQLTVRQQANVTVSLAAGKAYLV
ncbi:phage tail protein, partial [Chimaeribacter californicus]